MNCRQTSDRLPLFVGGDLAPAIAAQVEEHLSGCEICREELASYEDARQSLFALKGGGGGATPDLWPSIRKELSGPPRRFSVPLRPLAAAASVLVLLIGARSLLTDGPAPLIPPMEGVPVEVTVADPPAEQSASPIHEFLLEELLVAGEPAVYRTAPSLTTLEPERGGWDEF